MDGSWAGMEHISLPVSSCGSAGKQSLDPRDPCNKWVSYISWSSYNHKFNSLSSWYSSHTCVVSHLCRITTTMKHGSRDLLVLHNGTVKHSVIISAEVDCEVNLFNYPFASDECPVAIQTWSKDGELSKSIIQILYNILSKFLSKLLKNNLLNFIILHICVYSEEDLDLFSFWSWMVVVFWLSHVFFFFCLFWKLCFLLFCFFTVRLRKLSRGGFVQNKQIT